jgi:hypothetical protein
MIRSSTQFKRCSWPIVSAFARFHMVCTVLYCTAVKTGKRLSQTECNAAVLQMIEHEEIQPVAKGIAISSTLATVYGLLQIHYFLNNSVT